MFESPPSRADRPHRTGSGNPGARRRARAFLRGAALAALCFAAVAAPNRASADPLQLGPFAVGDIFQTPACSPSCTGADFPQDLGVLRTFTFTRTPGDVVTDILIEGVWGGTNAWSAPVEVYLGTALVATCTAVDACNTDLTGRLPWNGGAGFRLTDLGANLADFQHDDATLSVIQTGTAKADSVDLSGLQITVFVERTCGPEICDGYDNDCDLVIDNDITPIPTSCGVGECSANAGLLECQAGVLVDTCDPLAGALPDDQCDGLDNDCDGTPDDEYVATTTSCGVGACSANTGLLECQAGVPVDTCDPLAGAVPDDQCDGLDNDCDGTPDDEYVAADHHLRRGCLQRNTAPPRVPGGVPVDTCDPLAGALPDDQCDGLDNDCDGTPDDEYVATTTSCGVGACSANTGLLECQAGVPVDTCDPLAGAVPDDQCDGFDNDCDGTPDDEYVPVATTCGVGECSGNVGLLQCQGGVPFDTCDPLAGAAANDLCDGLDNDCDLAVDEDAAPLVTGSDVGECQTEIQSCVDGSYQVTQSAIGPVAETCNSLDDDCNGQADDGIADIVTGSDVGECQTEVQSCIGGAFQVTQAGIAPVAETCNGLDDDCNSLPDDGIADRVTGSDVGECQTEVQSCIGGVFQVTQAGIAPAAETCNGLDDDCNSLPDDGIADLVTGSDVGECQTEVQSCIGGAFQVTQAGIGPAAETCNGLDDDCDSVPDNDVADLVSGSDVGECQREIQSCVGGAFQVTQAGIAPAAETCNGLDDDCNGSPDNGIANLVAGTDVGECQTEVQSCVGGAFQVTQTGIGPTSEVCNGLDDDCNSANDDGIANIVTGSDVGECRSQVESCISGSFQVTQTAIPPSAETCNGLDDDCNSVPDDGIADIVTGSDVGECQTGIQSCVGGAFQVTQIGIPPSQESCNGLDDDCNGVEDNGIADIVSGSDVGECQSEVQSCVGGAFQVTQAGILPTTEVCNGLDDDCDTVPDDNIEDIVTSTDTGQCQAEIQSCIDGTFQITQTGVGPAPEVCNGLDDDCDTDIDEEIADRVNGSDVGECQAEIQSCIGGSFQVTRPAIGPTVEICNGLDDDCDTVPDDNVGNLVTGSDIGECQTEIQTCVAGAYEVTQTAIGPAAETCNSLDDDCNGQADDGIADVVTGTDVGECRTEIQSCVGGALQITQPGILPATETCNGLDDDCNSLPDDGIADLTTGTDVGECQTEIQSCIGGAFQVTQTAIPPTAETCNGLDDDCNSLPDDGIADIVTGTDVGACQSEIQSCVDGSFRVTQAAIEATAETCNGLDDDCNSLPDDGLADVVTGSSVGECQTEIQRCVGGAVTIVQAGIEPITEVCNGLDDDCDAVPDDGIQPIATGVTIGECRAEIQECIDGSFQVTQTRIDPTEEICNGKDENCNSIADDIPNIVTGSDVGECRTEIQSCLGGTFQVTQTEILPATEVCNGLDDDCDGEDDDGIADIVTGSDVGECQEGIQSCIGGSFQVTQVMNGPTSEICNGLDDDCSGVADNGFGPISCGVGVCETSVASCVDGVSQACVPLPGPGMELCLDGLDDDCDGSVDDGDTCELPSFDAWARDIELSQFSDRNLVLVAAEAGGLRLLEFSQLGPHPVGALDPGTCKDGFSTVPANVEDVDAESRSAITYLAAGPCGFWIASIADVSNPTFLAVVDTPGFALDVEVAEDDLLLFVADHNGGLELYDVSDPADPQELGHVGRTDANFGASIDVDFVDGIAYVATTRGLRVVDPSNVEAPTLIGAFDTPSGSGPGQDVEVVHWGDQTLAYLSAFQEGVYVLDVTEPTLPQMIARIPSRVPGVAAVYETTVAGTRAFLAEDSPELRIFDVSDPSDPLELDPFESRGHVWDVAVRDAVAYVGYGEDAFGATPGVDAVHVTTMGLQPADVGPVPEPTMAQLVTAALGTLLWLQARGRRRRTASWATEK